jgi:hypothetical protein
MTRHTALAIALCPLAAAVLLSFHARTAAAEEHGGFRVVNGAEDEAEPDEDDEAEESGEDAEAEESDESEDTEEAEEDDEAGEADESDEAEAEEGVEDQGAERRSQSPDRSHQQEVDPSDPWAVRVTPWPLFELSLVGAPIIRLFEMPIDRLVDGSRGKAHLETGYFGVVGFQLGLFPFARFRPRGLRGLGAEASACFAAGLDSPEFVEGQPVDASYREFDLNLAYNLFLGRLDVGGQVMVRLGWHETSFFLGDLGNDLVAPFEYDAFRFEVGARVPLRTRYLLAEARGAYLLVTSIGGPAAQAYGGEGPTPTTHGGEVRLGVIVRVGGLELSVTYIGRWFSSTFEGLGRGFGIDTDLDAAPDTTTTDTGIQTTGPAKDSYQQIRLGLGYRW